MRTRTDHSTNRLAELHERIAEGVAELVGSEYWVAMLEVAARFPAYRLGNVMLIMAQAPAATRVCGFRHWQQLGRQVRKGEKGIKILAPCSYAAPTGPVDHGPRRLPMPSRRTHRLSVSCTSSRSLTSSTSVRPTATHCPRSLLYC